MKCAADRTPLYYKQTKKVINITMNLYYNLEEHHQKIMGGPAGDVTINRPVLQWKRSAASTLWVKMQ